MRQALILAALAPAVLASSQAHPPREIAPDLPRPPFLISENVVARGQLTSVVEPPKNRSTQHSARHVLQTRSEASLGQTPWIGMAVGLTCTALAAVMLG